MKITVRFPNGHTYEREVTNEYADVLFNNWLDEEEQIREYTDR